jgi:hypothetical protein
VRLHGTTMRGLERTALSVGLLCGMMFGLSGCRHRPQIAPLPPIQTPVELEEIPPPANPPELEMPTEKLPALPTAAAAARQKREKKKVVAKVVPAPAPAPAQVVSGEPETEAAAIGALTAGEEASPKTKQDAAELISSIEKRLNSLPTQTVEEQKAQISKVKNFWRDADAALKSGDAEGAMTLATKAKLLLDDLDK